MLCKEPFYATGLPATAAGISITSGGSGWLTVKPRHLWLSSGSDKIAPMRLTRSLLIFPLAAVAFGQGGGRGPVNREANVTPVPFERILRANQEPQNWLTYSGSTMSQRHSLLTQITPDNAKDLTLKWVFQSRSLDKHEVTPLVVDGVMYTVQSPNDVIALDAATGKTIWPIRTSPREGTRNPCCGNLTRGVAILGDKLFLASLDAKMIALDAKTGKELWKTQVADYKQQYCDDGRADRG